MRNLARDTGQRPWQATDATLPDELKNLAGEPGVQPILESLRGKLRQWMAAQGDPDAK